MAQAQAGEGTAIAPRGLKTLVRRLRHLGGTTALLIAASAQAQSGACEQLKRSLAERLQGDPRSYSLEVVPSGTPLPRGGKFIGSCEGGARKILYRRGAAGEPASSPVAPALDVEVAAPRPVATPGAAPLPAATASGPVTAAHANAPHGGEPVSLEPAASGLPPKSMAGWSSAVFRFGARYWPWLLALLLVPMVWIAWAWWSHHRAYDAAGLPRGPRLRYR